MSVCKALAGLSTHRDKATPPQNVALGRCGAPLRPGPAHRGRGRARVHKGRRHERVQGSLCRRGTGGWPHSHNLLRRGRHVGLYLGGEWLRSSLLRLRQRRLARHPAAERLASERHSRSRHRHESPIPQQPQRDLHGCHSRSRPDQDRLGQWRLHRRLRQRRI